MRARLASLLTTYGEALSTSRFTASLQPLYRFVCFRFFLYVFELRIVLLQDLFGQLLSIRPKLCAGRTNHKALMHALCHLSVSQRASSFNEPALCMLMQQSRRNVFNSPARRSPLQPTSKDKQRRNCSSHLSANHRPNHECRWPILGGTHNNGFSTMIHVCNQSTYTIRISPSFIAVTC